MREVTHPLSHNYRVDATGTRYCISCHSSSFFHRWADLCMLLSSLSKINSSLFSKQRWRRSMLDSTTPESYFSQRPQPEHKSSPGWCSYPVRIASSSSSRESDSTNSTYDSTVINAMMGDPAAPVGIIENVARR